jgi:uncharacterized tellurite resistance protein B-like protein
MDKLQLFRNLMLLAASDGKLTEEEIAFLSLRSARWGISDGEFRAALADARDHRAEFVVPPGREQRRELLADMLRMMAVDGKLDERERNAFALVSAAMGLQEDELDELIDTVCGPRE